MLLSANIVRLLSHEEYETGCEANQKAALGSKWAIIRANGAGRLFRCNKDGLHVDQIRGLLV